MLVVTIYKYINYIPAGLLYALSSIVIYEQCLGILRVDCLVQTCTLYLPMYVYNEDACSFPFP